jgi:hypothetical protein
MRPIVMSNKDAKTAMANLADTLVVGEGGELIMANIQANR